MENKTNVVIAGEIITLRATDSPEYLQQLSLYVDGKLAEIKAKNVTAAINDRVRTLLIALNIADDYFKANDKYERLDKVHKILAKEAEKLRVENAKLEKKFSQVQAELATTRKEYDEFVHNFDNPTLKPIENGNSNGNNVLSLPKNRKAN